MMCFDTNDCLSTFWKKGTNNHPYWLLNIYILHNKPQVQYSDTFQQFWWVFLKGSSIFKESSWNLVSSPCQRLRFSIAFATITAQVLLAIELTYSSCILSSNKASSAKRETVQSSTLGNTYLHSRIGVTFLPGSRTYITGVAIYDPLTNR